MGGACIELDRWPYLVLAGVGVESLHALVGDRELTRRTAAAVIDARAFCEPGEPPDTSVFGRTADGQVAAALGSP